MFKIFGQKTEKAVQNLVIIQRDQVYKKKEGSLQTFSPNVNSLKESLHKAIVK